MIFLCKVGITNPIRKGERELRQITDSIKAGKGDLSIRLTSKGEDEIGKLIQGNQHVC